nr:hypothetical protein [Prescottella equi]
RSSTDASTATGPTRSRDCRWAHRRAMTLATRNPDLYRGVAALSGCMDTGRVESQGGGAGHHRRVEGRRRRQHVWGPSGDPAWPPHDPTVNAETLAARTSSSRPATASGPYELGAPDARREGRWWVDRWEAGLQLVYPTVRGAPLQLGIPATFLFRPYGTIRGRTGRTTSTRHGRRWPGAGSLKSVSRARRTASRGSRRRALRSAVRSPRRAATAAEPARRGCAS